MRDQDILPDPVTYISVLKASGSIGSLEMGEEIHEEVKKRGFLGKHILLSTTLVDMYAKCGMMEQAHKILLEDIPRRDVVSWNALITGYVQHGFGAEVLQCFRKMQDEGVCPDSVTFICILEACGSMGILEIGEEIHGVIKENGLLDKDIVVGTALIDMYSKCGALEKAHQVLRGLPKRNVVSWNTLISGYMQHGLGVEALKCFKAMHIDGISPDKLTFSFVFKTCGSIGFLNIGDKICATIKKEGLLGKDVALGTASVEMFSKCGMMQKALEVFEEIPHDDVASWNSLIRGYAQLGLTKKAFHLFEEMRIRGSMPNSATFHTLMAACSHAGLVKEGEVIFEDMINLFSLYPSLDHYTCLVDLFGRAGLGEKVRAILGKVPNTDYPPLLSSLLGSCCKWMDVDLGKWAFQKLIHVEKKCAAAYICMRNLYDALGLHEEAVKIETQRLENEACKVLGCWWMDPLNENSYIVDDVTHVASRETYLCNN
jgi:pentatricopeptide repeat protein